MTPNDLLTTREACEYLRVHRDTLRRWRVPVVYVGPHKRYRRAELDKLIQAKPPKAKEAAA